MMKHVVWKCKFSRGRIGVRLQQDDDRLEVTHLSGEAPPAGLLFDLLNLAFGPDSDWRAKAEALHRQRVHPWRVDARFGMSGARDYRLRVLQNEEWRDTPIRASVHVSMCGKLNGGLRLWLGDLPPLLAKVMEVFLPPDDCSFQVYEPDEPEGFIEAGADSGLQEVLDSQKAMEVLGK